MSQRSASVTSRRPYLLRAMHEWISDNAQTPHIVVDAQIEGVDVPRQYVKDGKIILNLSHAATSALKMGNEWVEFNARFGGVTRHVKVPLAAVLGIYASMAYLVERRSREIAIRIALGAAPTAVRRLVLARAFATSASGAALGVAAALAATKHLQAFFFGVTAHDAQVLVGAPLLLLGVGMIAAYGPARRASIVDPTETMRGD